MAGTAPQSIYNLINGHHIPFETSNQDWDSRFENALTEAQINVIGGTNAYEVHRRLLQSLCPSHTIRAMIAQTRICLFFYMD